MSTVSPYADALATAATAAMRAAVAGDDAALLEAVQHMSPGERLNVFRASRRLADFCGATANNQPNPQTPRLFALLLQRYEVERIMWGLAALAHHWPGRYGRGEMPPAEHRRVGFVRSNITRQMKMQNVETLKAGPE